MQILESIKNFRRLQVLLIDLISNKRRTHFGTLNADQRPGLIFDKVW